MSFFLNFSVTMQKIMSHIWNKLLSGSIISSKIYDRRRLDGTQGFPTSILFLTSLTYNFILETMNT